jgi:hypothetical protein
MLGFPRIKSGVSANLQEHAGSACYAARFCRLG